MKAVKENKVYTVTEEEAKEYKARGFDIYDDNGKLKENGTGKAIPYEEYEALKTENVKLKEENKKLKKELDKVKKGDETPEK